ncbi:hypothetical protein CPB86DRAFT_695448 [Serendipita vermifera]|nr:hypothetical protein CPB86DRAFT_695448 [Serendipita vermifera]
MIDLEVRQRLQTSSYGEGHQLMKWIKSPEVGERLADPALTKVVGGTCILKSGPLVTYHGTSMNVPAMSAYVYIAERNEVDTFFTINVVLPSYKQLAVVLRLSVSNDILCACAPAARKMLAFHLVNAMVSGLSSPGTIAIRGPLVTHPASNQQIYRRDAVLEEHVQGMLRRREVLFSYGA